MPISSQNSKKKNLKRSKNSFFQIEILVKDRNWNDVKNIRGLIQRVINVAVQYLKISIQNHNEVCVVLSNDKEIQNLNLTFRRKNYPTNVLSFPSAKKGGRNFMGDIVLARETIEREAIELNIPFVHHISHLTIHGFLHLMGYQHETTREANKMVSLEVAILSHLGILDPYKKISSPM